MTDNELLELAAKAIGISLNPVEVRNVNYEGDDRFIGYRTDLEEWPRGWFDPLQDDGDALRLVVKLSLPIEFRNAGFGYEKTPENRRVMCGRFWDYRESRNSMFGELYGDDKQAATRRVIVRAAAEIGKSMGEN